MRSIVAFFKKILSKDCEHCKGLEIELFLAKSQQEYWKEQFYDLRSKFGNIK